MTRTFFGNTIYFMPTEHIVATLLYQCCIWVHSELSFPFSPYKTESTVYTVV